jgi:hypothetical protein
MKVAFAGGPRRGRSFAGKTLGILGSGRIGQALARRAAAFDMRVIAMRSAPQAPPPQGVAFVGGPERFDDTLPKADYHAVTLSLSPATRRLLDAHRLAAMKPMAFVIDVARGDIRRECALRCARLGSHRRRRSTCVVSLLDRCRADAAVPRASQSPDDRARLRLDRGHDRSALPGDRREHRTDRTRRTAPQRDRSGGVTLSKTDAPELPRPVVRNQGTRSLRPG